MVRLLHSNYKITLPLSYSLVYSSHPSPPVHQSRKRLDCSSPFPFLSRDLKKYNKSIKVCQFLFSDKLSRVQEQAFGIWFG